MVWLVPVSMTFLMWWWKMFRWSGTIYWINAVLCRLRLSTLNRDAPVRFTSKIIPSWSRLKYPSGAKLYRSKYLRLESSNLIWDSLSSLFWISNSIWWTLSSWINSSKSVYWAFSLFNWLLTKPSAFSRSLSFFIFSATIKIILS